MQVMSQRRSLPERVWIKYRSYHKTNKLISIAISLSFVWWTLAYKNLAYAYYRAAVHAHVYPRHANLYNIALWFTFVYYSFQALGEAMELYSTVLGRDRGVIGLLFELNQIQGLVLAVVYAVWLVTGFYRVENQEYKALEWFVIVQALMVFLSLAACAVCWLSFRKLEQTQAARRTKLVQVRN